MNIGPLKALLEWATQKDQSNAARERYEQLATAPPMPHQALSQAREHITSGATKEDSQYREILALLKDRPGVTDDEVADLSKRYAPREHDELGQRGKRFLSAVYSGADRQAEFEKFVVPRETLAAGGLSKADIDLFHGGMAKFLSELSRMDFDRRAQALPKPLVKTDYERNLEAFTAAFSNGPAIAATQPPMPVAMPAPRRAAGLHSIPGRPVVAKPVVAKPAVERSEAKPVGESRAPERHALNDLLDHVKDRGTRLRATAQTIEVGKARSAAQAVHRLPKAVRRMRVTARRIAKRFGLFEPRSESRRTMDRAATIRRSLGTMLTTPEGRATVRRTLGRLRGGVGDGMLNVGTALGAAVGGDSVMGAAKGAVAGRLAIQAGSAVGRLAGGAVGKAVAGEAGAMSGAAIGSAAGGVAAMAAMAAAAVWQWSERKMDRWLSDQSQRYRGVSEQTTRNLDRAEMQARRHAREVDRETSWSKQFAFNAQRDAREATKWMRTLGEDAGNVSAGAAAKVREWAGEGGKAVIEPIIDALENAGLIDPKKADRMKRQLGMDNNGPIQKNDIGMREAFQKQLDRLEHVVDGRREPIPPLRRVR